MSSVYLYIYDISRGMVKQLSPMFLGKSIDGIWHTSVVVFGKEYFYGGLGITNCNPGQSIAGTPNQTILMGETDHSLQSFQAHMHKNKQRFSSESYSLLHHNCNTFTDEMCKFLVNKNIPSHITALPSEIMSTPIGQMILPLIQSIENPPNTQNSSSHFNVPMSGNIPSFPFRSPQNSPANPPENASSAPPKIKTAQNSNFIVRKAFDKNTKVYAKLLLGSESLSFLDAERTLIECLPSKIEASLSASQGDTVFSEAETEAILAFFQKRLFSEMRLSPGEKPPKEIFFFLALLQMLSVCGERFAAAFSEPNAVEQISAAAACDKSPSSLKIAALSALCNLFHCGEKEHSAKRLPALSRDENLFEAAASALSPENELFSRSTSAALLFNCVLAGAAQFGEDAVVRLLSLLFGHISVEEDFGVKKRLFLALERLLYGNKKAAVLVKTLGFELERSWFSEGELLLKWQSLEKYIDDC